MGVFVIVAVFVGVGVSVNVAVCVGVNVMVGVNVWVGDGVIVGPNNFPGAQLEMVKLITTILMAKRMILIDRLVFIFSPIAIMGVCPQNIWDKNQLPLRDTFSEQGYYTSTASRHVHARREQRVFGNVRRVYVRALFHSIRRYIRLNLGF